LLSQLAIEFAVLDRQKQPVLEELATFGQKLCQFRPDPAQWSAIDVVEHLVRTEQGILAEMRDALGNGNAASAVPVSNQVRGWLLTALFRTPCRVRVPQSAASVLPRRSTGLGQLAVQWSASREELAQQLERLQPSDLAKGVFRHPVSGWMTPRRVLAFLSAHLQHHGYQIQRLKTAGKSADWQA